MSNGYRITVMPDTSEMKQFVPQGQNLATTIGRNALFGMAATLIYALTRLITVPIVIKFQGLDGYGIWSIIMATAGYMRLGSAGVKSAYQKYVAEATGTGDFERASRIISTGTALMFALSIVMLTPICIFSTQLARVAGVPDKFIHAASASIFLLTLIIFVANVGAAFESIVLGAQRFDLVRKVNIISAIVEAICITVLLYLGKGLFAMSAVMAASEMVYIFYCVIISRRVLPQVHCSPRFISKGIIREFIVFAGSYQLLSIQEIIYSTILPLAVLRFFGASATGAYGVVSKLVQAVLMPQDAFLLPVLSGSSLVFASGSVERMRVLVLKAFKAIFGLCVLPLAIVCSAGTTIIYAWTGQKGSSFEAFLVLLSLAALFKALSQLQLVLYRASGKSLMDNIRQAIKIVILLVVGAMGRQLGMFGILGGLAFAEFAGMLFMSFTLNHAFPWFKTRLLYRDTSKLTLVAGATAIFAVLGANIPMPWLAGRSLALAHSCAIGGLTLSAVLPLLFLTGAMSSTEFRVILDLLPGYKRKLYAGQ